MTGDGGVCDSVSSDSVTSEKCQTGEKGSRETKEVEFVTLQVSYLTPPIVMGACVVNGIFLLGQHVEYYYILCKYM